MKTPRTFVWAVLIALALAGGAGAQEPPPPKLIVAIAVDQFSADLFGEYRPHFKGGLKRLSEEGVVFPSGYQSHAATETCPGHSTILTGSRPARTGIIANNWYDFRITRGEKKVYCAEDESDPASSPSKPVVSAVHLQMPTLGERLKAADPASKNVVVAGKDRAAAMMAGQFKNADQVWWWNGDAMAFVGPSTQTPTAAIGQENKNTKDQIGTPQTALRVSSVCQAREREIQIGSRTVGSYHFARPAKEKDFRYSPELDRATLRLATALIADENLGGDDATDVLAIGLSATDFVGHLYGTAGVEMCLNLMELDDALATFFQQLDARRIDYVVILTADHGGQDVPERLREHGIPEADRAWKELAVEQKGDIDTIGELIAKELGLSGQALFGEFPGDLYVEMSLPPEVRAEVLARARKRYLAHSQVEMVFTALELELTPLPKGPPDTWSLAERARASFSAKRSGDLVALPRPRLTPYAPPSGDPYAYVATHGSPWNYDRRVPILFWRKGLIPFEQPLAVETVDILPTLAAVAKLPIPPGEIDGRCLDLDAGPNSTCP